MAKTLTNFYANYTADTKRSFGLKGWLIAITVFVLLIVVVVSAVIKNSPTKNYKAKNFYFVYAGNFNNRSAATECADKVSGRGGAGVIYSVGNTMFVITSVYTSGAEADTVAEQIKTAFSTAGVLKISSKAVPKNLAKQMHQTIACREYYKLLSTFSGNILDWLEGYANGQLDASKLYKNIMQVKQNVSNLSDSLKEINSDAAKTMFASSLVASNQISTFFSSAFSGSDTVKYCYKLAVNIAIEFIDMCSLL